MLSYSFFDFLLLFLYVFAFKSAVNEAVIISRYQKMQTFTNLKTKGQTIAKANYGFLNSRIILCTIITTYYNLAVLPHFSVRFTIKST